MVKGRVCVWAVLLVIGLLGFTGCNTVESPATVATMHTPVVVNQGQTAASLDTETVEALAPVANATDAVSDPVLAGVANPASVYCEEQGGHIEVRDSAAGQYNACVFESGQECDAEAF
ncbi:MAG: DUF333 domain-containing protein, partial [Anaerolineae bacterium]|nr:DUF333 domain-containing protein [Anaerolineae bacterium]